MPFLQVDYRYLKNRAYLEFLMTPAHVTWMFLRARIFRPSRNGHGHPNYIGFYNQGWLAAHANQSDLVKDWMGLRQRGGIETDIRRLVEMRLIEYYPSNDGYPSVFRLGSWTVFEHPGHRQQQLIEVLYADRLFLIEESEPWADPDGPETPDPGSYPPAANQAGG